MWCRAFGQLGKLSSFVLLRTFLPTLAASDRLVEYYVVVNTALSVLALVIVTWRRDEPDTPLLLAVMCYGVFRTFEIFVYQMNVLLFDEYRAHRAGRPFGSR